MINSVKVKTQLHQLLLLFVSFYGRFIKPTDFIVFLSLFLPKIILVLLLLSVFSLFSLLMETSKISEITRRLYIYVFVSGCSFFAALESTKTTKGQKVV